MMELCSWCRTRLATRWHFWTQDPDGSGQEYLYCSCEQCHSKQDNKWFEKSEVTRDEWIVAHAQAR